MNEILTKIHPWNILLKEHRGTSKKSKYFPEQSQVAIMKKVMDGETLNTISKDLSLDVQKVKKLLTHGMKMVGVNNLYELIVWGLKRGIISDKPINVDLRSIPSDGFAQPAWLIVLNLTVSGYSNSEISKDARLSNDSIKFYKDWTAKKFNLGPSEAKYIRFGFQLLNPITPIAKMNTPHKAKVSPYQTIKNPPVLSKFKPADIDPSFTPRYQTLTGKGITGNIQVALTMLGINKNVIRNPMSKYGTAGSFWDNRPEYLWDMLELAKKRYEYEFRHSHPDVGGDPRRFSQVTTAWKYIKEMFGRRGFELYEP